MQKKLALLLLYIQRLLTFHISRPPTTHEVSKNMVKARKELKATN